MKQQIENCVYIIIIIILSIFIMYVLHKYKLTKESYSQSSGKIVKMSIISPVTTMKTADFQPSANTWETVYQTTYAPKSNQSTLIIDFNTSYKITYPTNATTDSYIYSRILTNSDTTSEKRQNWYNVAGGDTRSGTLFPIKSVYSNRSYSAVTIEVQIKGNTPASFRSPTTTDSIMQIIEILS